MLPSWGVYQNGFVFITSIMIGVATFYLVKNWTFHTDQMKAKIALRKEIRSFAENIDKSCGSKMFVSFDKQKNSFLMSPRGLKLGCLPAGFWDGQRQDWTLTRRGAGALRILRRSPAGEMRGTKFTWRSLQCFSCSEIGLRLVNEAVRREIQCDSAKLLCGTKQGSRFRVRAKSSRGNRPLGLQIIRLIDFRPKRISS